MGNDWTITRYKYLTEEVQFIEVILQKLQSTFQCEQYSH